MMTNDGVVATIYFERGTQAFWRVAKALFSAGLATFAILYCVQPIFPMFTATFHISPASASLSLSVTTTCLAIALPFAGMMSDTFGRKNVMALSLSVSAVLCLLTSVVQSFTLFVIVRGLMGISIAGIPAVAMAYLSEEIEKGSLGYAMGLYISGNSIGGLLGRLIVSFLADLGSWRLGIAMIGGLSLLASLFFWRSLPTSRHFQPQTLSASQLFTSLLRPFHDMGLVYLYAIGALLMGGFVTLFNYIGFRLMAAPYHLSQSVIGVIFCVYLIGTFSSSWMGRVADRVGRRKVLGLNLLLMLLGTLTTLNTNLLLIFVGMSIFTFGFFAAHSIASSWVGRRALTGKGQASALYLLFYYMGSGIGGTTGGFFWVSWRWEGVVWMIAIMLGAGLAISLLLVRIPPIQPKNH